MITTVPFTESVNFLAADTEGPIPASDGPCWQYEGMVWYKFKPSTDGSIGIASLDNYFLAAVFYRAANENASSFSDLIPVSPCYGSVNGAGTNCYANNIYYAAVFCAFPTTVLIASTSVLPVKLVSFSGVENENKILLEWETSYEEDNSGFVVQKLIENDWKDLGFIAASKKEQGPYKYFFHDGTALKEHNYYRLKQLDINRKFSYSRVIEVGFQGSYNFLKIYPNPFSKEVFVQINTSKNYDKLVIFNSLGRAVKVIDNVQELVRLDLSDLERGVYILQLWNNSKMESIRVIKS